MRATVDLQVIPLGDGISVRQKIMQVVALLQGQNFILHTHAAGTNIEGDLTDILAAIEQIHQMLHDQGSVRLLSYLKVETRTDKEPTLAGKKL